MPVRRQGRQGRLGRALFCPLASKVAFRFFLPTYQFYIQLSLGVGDPEFLTGVSYCVMLFNRSIISTIICVSNEILRIEFIAVQDLHCRHGPLSYVKRKFVLWEKTIWVGRTFETIRDYDV